MTAPTEKLFDDIAQFIAESNAIIERGAFMELAGLDDQVRTLCDMVLQLSQAERLRYADRLQYLLGELKKLGESMTAERDRVGNEMRGVPEHKKASVAYRVADSRDGFGARDDEEPQ